MSRNVIVYVCTALVLALTCAGAGATTYYVDDDAAGGDGLSWANAFNDLQDALTAASSGGGDIWVAEGLYIPGTARSDTFQLINGVTIYGGFPDGGGGIGDRNIELYKTILSGDLADNDDPNNPFVFNADNSYHVVTGSGTTGAAILTGFTITGGNADGSSAPDYYGGGLLIYGTTDDVNAGSPLIDNCTFRWNSAAIGGGALSYRGSPTFAHCTFWANRATLYGGGFYNTGGSPLVVNCSFINNTAPKETETVSIDVSTLLPKRQLK